MEKVELQTADIAAENAAKLAELFPDIVTEVLDEDGNVRHSIDVEALKAHVGDIAEDKRERYQFTWPGKQRARAEAIRQIDKTMRPCPEESVNWDTTENLYIEGDNLDALKILRETYAGKIKMIYIDPPYNTGHDLIYKDSHRQSQEDMDTLSSIRDDEGNQMGSRFELNSETSGTFHSDWCSMMYERLVLVRDLLSDGGIIYISIDDNEACNLEKICNEVFGARSFVNSMVWVSNLKGRQIGTSGASKCTESVLCYAKCPEEAPLLTGDVNELKTLMPSAYRGLDYDVMQDQYGQFVIKNELYNSNSIFNEETRPNLVYEIYWNPDTDEVKTARIGEAIDLKGFIRIVPHRNSDGVHKYHAWRWGREKVEAEKHDLYFKIMPDGSAKVFSKVREHNRTSFKSIITDMSTSSGSKEVAGLFGVKRPYFDYSKPTDLIRLLAKALDSKEAIVLDFFSGSATTAHAVMRLNAEDGGNRKFIMVQLPEVCDEKSEAAKAGYKNICEIGKERIRRAGAKIVAEVEEANAQLKLGEEPKRVPDIGFRVLKIDSTNFEDVSRTPDAIQQDQLFGMADNLKPGRTSEDILFQLFPQLEIPYTACIDKLDICGKTVYSVDDDMLLACFDREVPEDVIRAMAEREPAWAVLRDGSFVGDDALANFEEIFKTISPETKTRVV